MGFRLSNGGFFWLVSWILINTSNAVNDVTSSPSQLTPESTSLEEYLLKIDVKTGYTLKTINEIEDKLEPLLNFSELLQPIRNEVQELKRMIVNLTKSTSKTCSVTSNGRDYECTGCPSPTPNKNCEGLSHNYTSFWLNDTMYVMFRDRSVTWYEAKTKCEREGMVMAMPKDRLTHQFLRQMLFSFETPRNDVYWIGLSRPTLGYKWQWEDGSELTGYKGWAFTPIHTEQCVDIARDEGFDFNWDADPCSGVGSWVYYALCQSDLSLSGDPLSSLKK